MERLFPVPQKEAEGLIRDWLEARGYDVARKELGTGRIEITGRKTADGWRIGLQPRSPLATRVRAERITNGEPDPDSIRRLWADLSTKMQALALNFSPGSSQFVPTEVLMRMESVVCIHAGLKTREIQFSGFIVDPSGLILCTAHDLEKIRQMSVTLFDGRNYNAEIVKKDLRRDLILLRVRKRFDAFIPLGHDRNLIGMGEQLYTVGCPVNLQGTVHTGFVNGPPRLVEGLPLWQVDLQILPGSSGSPVFDFQGKLVGIVKGRYRGTRSVGFVIPMETIMAFMKER